MRNFTLCSRPSAAIVHVMFDTLTGKLQNAFRNLRGLGKISENNVSDSLREVRMAMLDADVNFKVVKEFMDCNAHLRWPV